MPIHPAIQRLKDSLSSVISQFAFRGYGWYMVKYFSSSAVSGDLGRLTMVVAVEGCVSEA